MRPNLMRTMAWTLTGLLIAVSLAPAATPRFELEAPAGGPYLPGDQVVVPLYLLGDARPFKYVSFGIESDAGNPIWFGPSAESAHRPGVDFFNDRLIDLSHAWVGMGNFDFGSAALVMDLIGGRLLLGTVTVEIGDASLAAGGVALRVGECRCTQPDLITLSVLDLGPGGKVEPAGASIRLAVGNRNFIRGDANNDRKLDIADPLRILSDLFWGAHAIGCPKAFDAKDDGAIDLSDPVFILDHLFLGGPPPPAPFPQAGPDPTPDGLSCR